MLVSPSPVFFTSAFLNPQSWSYQPRMSIRISILPGGAKTSYYYFTYWATTLVHKFSNRITEKKLSIVIFSFDKNFSNLIIHLCILFSTDKN